MLSPMFQAARTAAQLRFPVQAAVLITQNQWIAGGRIVHVACGIVSQGHLNHQ